MSIDREQIAIIRQECIGGALAPRPKCCSKCAFRYGSPERSDPYGWMRLVEGWMDGETFLCHEGIPGHSGQKVGAPIQICAGRLAANKMTPDALYRLAQFDRSQRGEG
jgi:hypothetical protein